MQDYMIAGSVGGLIAIAVYTVLQYLLRPKRLRVTPNYDRDMNMVSKSVVLEPGPLQNNRRAMIMALQAQGYHRVFLDGLTDAQLKCHIDGVDIKVRHDLSDLYSGKDSHARAQQKEKREPRH